MPSSKPFDLLIVGGGINGAGIACDAAGRGMSVLLCEQGDLAGATSSASSKLIHGGLRYLEHHDFRLVREALKEREILLAKAPHMVRPLRFILPHRAGLRPRWMIRAGLFLYDRLGGRGRLPGSSAVDLRDDPAGRPLAPGLEHGFAYYDCQVDDARLVVLNALAAAEGGAEISVATRFAAARRVDGQWEARLVDVASGAVRTVRARALVNAAGPWVQRVRDEQVDPDAARGSRGKRVRLIRGSHLVVPRLYDGDHAYILQHPDGRVVFVIPFEADYSLLGTTDIATDDDPADVRMSHEEAVYICAAVGEYFTAGVTPADAVWSFAGARALFDDGADNPSAITREYALEVDAGSGAPLLSVLGGKITTYRRLAEEALEKLRPFFPGMAGPWTQPAPLPGGDLGGADFGGFLATLARSYPRLDNGLLTALARRHGSRARDVLGDARDPADLGRDFGGGLFEREVDYLAAHEWARNPDDILWRRTKCGLHMSEQQRREFAERFGAFALVG